MAETKKPIIFLAFANDQQDKAHYLRGLAKELSAIRSALTPAVRAGVLEVIERANASITDIIDVFQAPEYAGRIAVFHYGGHANSYQLLLESATGAKEYANAEAFSRFLGRQNGLQLVFLNGCATKEQSNYLRQNNIPCVIATSNVINDEYAYRFALRFYKGMGSYQNISKCFQDAFDEISIQRSGKSDTFRDLYWEGAAEDEVEKDIPWKLIPDSGSDWRVAPPVAASVPDKSKIGDYVYLLCNRQQQTEEFSDLYTTSILQNIRKPNIFLIHGIREDHHEGLIDRFSYENIGKKTYIRPNKIGKWPSLGNLTDLQRKLKLSILEGLEGMTWQGRDINAINGLDILNHPHFTTQKNVIFAHSIDGESWTKETASLLNWFVGEFWNFEIQDRSIPNVTIFINIYYTEEQLNSGFFSSLFSKTYKRKGIVEELSSVAKKHSTHCKLLPELNIVRRNDVEAWLDDTSLRDISDFLNLSQNIFLENGKVVEELRMLPIEKKLQDAIQKYNVRNSGIFQ